MTDAQPNSVPKEPGRWRAIALATVVHAALFAFLWFGVRWQSETPVAIEAEVWSPQVREAAPRPRPAPEPEPKPEPVVKPPAPVVVPPPAIKPDIALEQERKRKVEEQKARDEKVLVEKRKAEEKRIEQEKSEAAARKKRAAEEAKKALAEKQRKLDAADEMARTEARENEMKRIAEAATGAGSGDAPKSQGSRADASYVQKLMAIIKSNTVFNVPDNVAGDAAVEYLVELLPDGSVRKSSMKKSSGVPGFDQAVQRAIEKSAPYPRDKSGNVPSGFTVIHKPKDQ